MILIRSPYGSYFTLLTPPENYDIRDLADEFKKLGLESLSDGRDNFIRWLISNKGFTKVKYTEVPHPFV